MLWQGIAFVVSLLLSGFVGSLFMVFPAFLLFFFTSFSMYRKTTDTIGSLWFQFVAWLLEDMYGTKIVLAGADLQLENHKSNTESAILISNHRTRLDWMFLWSFVMRVGHLGHEKIILKESLRKVPFYGWAMQCFCFLFLKRRWEEDEQHITRVLSHHLGHAYPLQILLFPEGTDLSESNKKKSQEFAKKNNLAQYEYVLHPRVRGWQHTCKTLDGLVNAVWDITIGYPDYIPQNESSLFTGHGAKEIHFHMKRYEFKDIPKDDKALEDWCIDRWKEKEDMLSKFYKEKQFPETVVVSDKQQRMLRWKMRLVAAYWWTSIVLAFYALFQFSAVRWYVLIAFILNVIITWRGGFDGLELSYHAPARKGKHE